MATIRDLRKRIAAEAAQQGGPGRFSNFAASAPPKQSPGFGRIAGTDDSKINLSDLSHHEDGGELDSDKVNIVGEDGPEAIVGDEVIPNEKSEGLLGKIDTGDTPSLKTYGPQQTPEDAQRSKKDYPQTTDQPTAKAQAAPSMDLIPVSTRSSALGNALAPSPEDIRAGSERTGKLANHDELQFQRYLINNEDKLKAASKGDLVGLGTANIHEAELNKQNPYGSAANHPGILGKILHGVAEAGNIAGDVLAPAATSLIPGTDLNRERNEQEGFGQIKQGTEDNLQNAQTVNQLTEARSKLNPKPEYVEFREPVFNPKTGNYEAAAYNKSNPQDIVYGGEAAAKTVTVKDADVQLGNKIPTINQQLEDRYQVLNPGKPLPTKWTLPADATAGDYARIDKSLEQVEKAQGTKAQQDTANAMRQQAAAAMQNTRDQAADAKGRKMVIGTNPKTNREEMVPESASDGLTDVYDAPADAVNKALSARHFIPLADNKSQDDPGILQMIDRLDGEGKIGTVTSRWNDFMAGKVGAGDPDFERLRVAMGLATTLLMNAHVGSRGGAYMMEHFEDLANAGKMNAQTLRAGVDQELKYVRNRAMVPASRSNGSSATALSAAAQRAPKGATHIGDGPDGKKHYADAQGNDLGVVVKE